MNRIVGIFAMSVLAVSCAGKSADNVAGSETVGKALEGIRPGAVFSISTPALQKAVQKSVGTS